MKKHRFCRYLAAKVKKPYTTVSDIDIAALPQPGVFLVRHNDLKGPVNAFLSLKNPAHLWVLDVFFSFSSCYEQYRSYTFSVRRGKKIPAVSLKAAVSALAVAPLMRYLDAIPVYRGKRDIMQTLELSAAALAKGESLIIAVDKDYSNKDAPVSSIYTGFFRLEQSYFDATGEHLPFIPLCFDEGEHNMIISSPLYFQEDAPFYTERQRLAKEVIAALNQI